MYKGRCFTNLDDYRTQEWPSSFIFPPRVGDYVEAASGKRLKVVSVMHSGGYSNRTPGEPFVVIELHK